jgi:hypothetical protein
MEHCTGKGSDKYFVTNNYNIRTCPKDEWLMTVLHDLTKAKSPESRAHNRRFVPIAELMQVEVAVQAQLTRAEVIAVVLYTGPMVSRPHAVCRPLGSCAFPSRRCQPRRASCFPRARPERRAELSLNSATRRGPAVCLLQRRAASVPE